FFDLLRAGVLAREEDVFVERHPMPFPCSLLYPARSPSSHFGKGSSAQKAGTRDAGPSALLPGIGQAAVRSVPSRDRAEARVIRRPREKARRLGTGEWVRLNVTGYAGRCDIRLAFTTPNASHTRLSSGGDYSGSRVGPLLLSAVRAA